MEPLQGERIRGVVLGCKSSFWGERAGGGFWRGSPCSPAAPAALARAQRAKNATDLASGSVLGATRCKEPSLWERSRQLFREALSAPQLPPHSQCFPVHGGPRYPACGAGGCTASHPGMLFQGCSWTTEMCPPSPARPPGGEGGRARLTPRHSYPIAAPTPYLLYVTAAARAAAARSSQGGVKQSKKPSGRGSSNPQLPGKGRGPTKEKTATWFFLVRSPASPRRPVQFLPTLIAVHKEGNRISRGFPSSC